jgi:hypothetical protein
VDITLGDDGITTWSSLSRLAGGALRNDHFRASRVEIPGIDDATFFVLYFRQKALTILYQEGSADIEFPLAALGNGFAFPF